MPDTARTVALITGASSGIGAEFARQLAQRGFDLILVARREEKLRAIAAGLPCASHIVVADLATRSGVDTVAAQIERCERLDLLVNNAGFGTLGRFWEADLAGQQRMHDVHVSAILRLTHAALGRMVAASKGAVVNVSSVAAYGQSPGNVSYCATKAWINSFTEGLDMELRGIGSPVRVQALCPGFTITEFHDTLGLNRKLIPGFLWMPVGEVVTASLNAIEKGPVVMIPGWKYKIGAALLKHLPHSLKRRAGRPGGKRV